jgi:hypothetical protein
MDMDPDRQTLGLQERKQRRKKSRVLNWWMLCLELGSPFFEPGRNMDIFFVIKNPGFSFALLIVNLFMKHSKL